MAPLFHIVRHRRRTAQRYVRLDMKTSRIDKAILAVAQPGWLKVARVIADAARVGDAGVPDTEEGFQAIAQCIEALVGEGRLISQGNLSQPRHSEVRLPGPLVTAPAMNACVRNLRLLSGVKHIWARQNHRSPNDAPTWADLRPYLRQKPRCPQHGNYTLVGVGEPPTCSYGQTYKIPE